MNHDLRPVPFVSALTRPAACAGALALASLSAAAQSEPGWKNLTSGTALRPGVYGHIVVGPDVAPPPVIYRQPMRVKGELGGAQPDPIYLYVPPGQVRKWKRHCAKWAACDKPVLFVRVDDSPSRWGQWKHRRDQVATLRDED